MPEPDFAFDDSGPGPSRSLSRPRRHFPRRTTTIALIAGGGLLVSCLVCGGIGALFSDRNEVADESVGMGLSEARVLGEGTRIGRFEANARGIFPEEVVTEINEAGRRVYRLRLTTLEIRGPRENVTGVYVRTPTRSLGNEQIALESTFTIAHVLSTILNPDREEGRSTTSCNG